MMRPPPREVVNDPLRQARPRSDTGTIVIHWVMVIAVLVSLFTGLRIAADASDAVIAPWFEAILPNGEVWTFHIFAGLALFACTSAYIVYLRRAALARRNSLKRTRALTLPVPAKMKWAALNVLLHWLAYIAIVLLTATGGALYLGHGGWIVPIHRICAYFVLSYIFVHTLAHYFYGGVWQLLRLFRPAALVKNDLVRPFPLLMTFIAAAVAMAAIVSLDHGTRPELIARATETAPALDGRLDDAVWRHAAVAVMPTQQGENTKGFMASRVEARAAYDAENIYFAFRWNDPTRSLMRLPLRKESDGWRILGSRVGTADVMDYYEDKFAVLFATEPAFGGAGATHMGRRPLGGKPGAANSRGLHYTRDGSILDLWQWKAARGGMLGHVDDMHIGPPVEPDDAQKAGKARYSAGYAPDPGQAIYIYNYKAGDGGYGGPVEVLRLPADYRAVEAGLKSIPDTPDGSNDHGSVWWMTEETSVPYSQALDAQIPVGTVIPSVLNIREYQGDRADVSGGAHYQDGHWTLEIARKRDTGSQYDTVFEPGTRLAVYVSVFDHVQTRHTRHERPILLDLR